jgi:intracellular multiplication protein IcmO
VANIEREYQLDDRKLYFDTRGMAERISDRFQYPQTWRLLFFVLAAIAFVAPFATELLCLAFAVSAFAFLITDFQLPLRMPKDLGGKDPFDKDPKTGAPQDAGGIFYLGVERSLNPFRKNREVWLTNSDNRMHKLVLGTTGAGKTRKLLGWLFNAVAWGSGATMCDGKGDTELVANVRRMTRIAGREHDVLIMNFLRGGADQFIGMVARERGEVQLPRTNSFNPSAEAGADMQTQLLTSLLPKAEGDSKSWQDKAINMMDGVVRLLCYLRARGEIQQISFETYREYISLPKLCEIFKKAETDPTNRFGGLPALAYQPIRSYLMTGLPGFNGENAKQGKPQSNDASTQHGYLTGQFARTLGLMCDTYGDVFRARFSEINMRDVALNNRFLLIVLPALEKSPQEINNLGRLVVAASKLMMAQLLGDEIDGDHDAIIESKVSRGPTPLEMLWDEVGCYFSDGFGAMTAQGRSIGTAQTLAGQDLAAMGKGGNEAEVEVVVANTKLKDVMASEDPKQTLELVNKLAGQISVSRRSGDEMETGVAQASYRTMTNIGVETVDAVKMRELKGQGAGESVSLFLDRIVRLKSFDPMDEIETITKKRKLAYPYKLNRFIEIVPPTPGDLEAICATRGAYSRSENLFQILRGFKKLEYATGQDPFSDPLLNDLRNFAESIPDRLGAMERGIALFMEFDRLLEETERLPAQSHGTAPGAPSDAVAAPGSVLPVTLPEDDDVFGEDFFSALHVNQEMPFADKPRERIGQIAEIEALVSSTTSQTGTSSAPKAAVQAPLAHSEVLDPLAELLGSFDGAKAPTTSAPLQQQGAALEVTNAAPAGNPAQSIPSLEDKFNAMMGDAFDIPPEAPPVPPQAPASTVERTAKPGARGLGFVDPTLSQLFEIEELIASERPVEVVAESEEEIATTLEFKPTATGTNAVGDGITDDDMEALFNRMNSIVHGGTVS